MERIFAVLRTQGAGWNPARSLEEQEDWLAHAAFMNALQADGFVVVGGLLAGTPDVLLIIRARDAAHIRARLADDPWSARDLLRISRIVPWILRLGSLP